MYENQNLESYNPNDYDIYLRKSRKDMDFSADESIEKTLERHEKQLQDYAKRLFGSAIPEENIFREIVSGDTIADRPKMQEVLQRIESENRKGVIVVEIERLARGNTIDQGIIAQAFQYSNTKIFTPMKIFDLNDDFDRTFFEDGLYQSRKYLLYTKKILSRGKEQSAKEGKFVNSQPAWCWDKIKLPKEKGYKLVRNSNDQYLLKMAELFLEEDLGTQNTAHKLNALNIPSPSGNVWTPAMIRKHLQNPVNAGYIVYNKRKRVTKIKDGEKVITCPVNKDCIMVKGLHYDERIFDDEMYERIINKFKINSTNKVPYNKKTKSALRGIVKCTLCGGSMQRRPYNNGHTDILLCSTARCENISSELKIIESRILDLLEIKLKEMKFYLENYEEEFIKKNNDNTALINSINKEIDKLKKQYTKACELLETEVYTIDVFKERTNYINEQIKSKETQKSRLENENKEDKIEIYKKGIPNIEYCLKNYNKVKDAENQNKLLKSVIEKVTYLKTEGGRWNPSARDKFELDIKLKF